MAGTALTAPAPSQSGQRRAFQVTLAALVVVSLVVFWPLWPWLTLAAWFAALARPLVERLAPLTHGKRPAAAIATMILLVVSIGPVLGVLVALAADAVELVRDVISTRSGRQAVIAVVSPEAGAVEPELGLSTIVQMVRSEGERAWSFASGVAGATADLALGLFVFFAAAYFALVDGSRAFDWLERHTPMAHRHATRFAAAFVETGRGLVFGIGLTGLVQATIATVAYAALGVPRALVLGLITFVASFLPTIGTALVWVPVAIGLGVTGRVTEALVLAVIGVVVVGSVDNLLRPVLARWGKLQMHGFLVLTSMLGGLAVIGGWGLLLGPLVVRLTLEALTIAKEERLV